ncbi:MAG: hypothetical protein HY315_05175 [Acidobacteria bacterium]|nr:hypothetical protein [Acidobacteriota bacterium]
MGGGAGLVASVAAFQETLGPYRPHFTVGALLFLALAHYRFWFQQGGQGTRWTQIVLWLSTALTIYIVFDFLRGH